MDSSVLPDDDEQVELDLPSLEKLDKVLRRRIYLRNIRRTYRHREKQERLQLLDTLSELEAKLQCLKQPRTTVDTDADDGGRKATSTLTWEDVAEAMREENSLAELENKFLKHEVERVVAFGRQIQRWIFIQNGANPKGSLKSRDQRKEKHMLIENIPRRIVQVPTWRDTTLFADPELRKLGKQWITQLLYHNTDRMFQSYWFPQIESPSSYIYVDAEFDENTYNLVFCRQYEDITPFERLCELYRRELCDQLAVEGSTRIRENTVKEQEEHTIQHQMITRCGEVINLVCGEFHEEGRSLFVAQQIIDDELFLHDHRMRNRMCWIEIRAMPNGKCKKRLLCYQTHCFTKTESAVPLAVEVSTWGLQFAPGMSDEKKAMAYKKWLQNQLQYALE
ncbi:hypothetical protein AeMF1_008978 [Aphanomyces euteiches]|nr:hypothetical protein AeMF1_008978 [Aphanomyces euteiches]KAH9189900.1 hypothetical protein AeNC1_008124 [Aphanomyces euteiches]